MSGLSNQAVHFVILAAESQISESVTPGTDLDRHQVLGIDHSDRPVYQQEHIEDSLRAASSSLTFRECPHSLGN